MSHVAGMSGFIYGWLLFPTIYNREELGRIRTGTAVWVWIRIYHTQWHVSSDSLSRFVSYWLKALNVFCVFVLKVLISRSLGSHDISCLRWGSDSQRPLRDPVRAGVGSVLVWHVSRFPRGLRSLLLGVETACDRRCRCSCEISSANLLDVLANL